MESVHATVLKNRGVEGQELAWLETHKRGKSGCVEYKLGKKVSVPIVCVSARHELPQVIYVSFSHFHSDLSTAGEREGPLLPGEWLTPTANVSNGFLTARRTLLGASRTRLSNMPLRRETCPPVARHALLPCHPPSEQNVRALGVQTTLRFCRCTQLMPCLIAA